jgi:hypothetical protein
MTNTDQKTSGTWMPFAPIAIGVMLTVCAIVADHGSIAAYNDAQLTGVASPSSAFAAADETTLQVSLRK